MERTAKVSEWSVATLQCLEYIFPLWGPLEFSLPEGDCRAVHTPGRMDYTQGGVEIEAQVLRSTDAALWRITNTTGRTVDVPVTFGGVSGRKFYREGDLGVDAPDCFGPEAGILRRQYPFNQR